MKKKVRTSTKSAPTSLVAKLKNEPPEFVEVRAKKMIAELIPVLELLRDKYAEQITALKSSQDLLR